MKWIPKEGDYISVRMPHGGYFYTIIEHDIGGTPCFDNTNPEWSTEYDISNWRYNLLASVKARLARKNETNSR